MCRRSKSSSYLSLFLVVGVPSDSLLFVDKSRDLLVKRKIDKHREKILRVDSILEKNSFVQAVPSSTQKKSKIKQKKVHLAEISSQACCTLARDRYKSLEKRGIIVPTAKSSRK